MLMVYLTILIAFVGWVIPNLLRRDYATEVQKQVLALESRNRESQEALEKQLRGHLTVESEKVATSLKTEMKVLSKKMASLVAMSVGHNAMTDGDAARSEDLYTSALFAYVIAAEHYLLGGQDGRVRMAVKKLRKTCLPKIREGGVVLQPKNLRRLKELRTDLEKANSNGRYTDCIRMLGTVISVDRKNRRARSAAAPNPMALAPNSDGQSATETQSPTDPQ
jgi:hypothetical protein